MAVYWLASYPKSGNTWVRALLSAYFRSEPGRFDLGALAGDQAFAQRALIDDLLGVPSADLYADELARLLPRACEQLAVDVGDDTVFVKTHSALGRTPEGRYAFPPEATAGVLYIVRNPLDVVVSFASFLGRPIPRMVRLLNTPGLRLNPDPGTRRSAMLPERLMTWSQHVESWLDAEEHRTLVVRYEDLLADAAAAFTRILAFVGEEADVGRVQEAVEATRFDRLQAAEARTGFRERPPTAARFFRQGRAGAWREALTPEQAVQIVTDHAAVMRRLGYDALVEHVRGEG